MGGSGIFSERAVVGCWVSFACTFGVWILQVAGAMPCACGAVCRELRLPGGKGAPAASECIRGLEPQPSLSPAPHSFLSECTKNRKQRARGPKTLRGDSE